MQFAHNSNVFGSCIIHILYTGVLKLKKKNNSCAKSLMYLKREGFTAKHFVCVCVLTCLLTVLFCLRKEMSDIRNFVIVVIVV